MCRQKQGITVRDAGETGISPETLRLHIRKGLLGARRTTVGYLVTDVEFLRYQRARTSRAGLSCRRNERART